MEKLNELISKLNISENPNPFKTKDINTLAELLKASHFKKIAVMVGAGISVSAGIPDFRSKGGLYETLKAKGHPKPEIVFDLGTFRKNPSLFYTVGGELDTSDKEPTLTHYFLKLLEDKGILMNVFSQNIDSLEVKAGLSSDKLVQAHGHFNSSHCIECDKEGDIEVLFDHLKKQTVYYCESCSNPIKPDVVFFGEQLPDDFGSKAATLPQADLLIIIGTSLVVYPFASLVNMVRKGIPRIYINKHIEQVGNFSPKKSDIPDIAFESESDSFLRELCNLCGWSEDLDKLLKNEAYLGSLDIGTGSVRFIVFDKSGNRVNSHQIDLKQHFPGSNMHEQDPNEYLSLAFECIAQVSQSIDTTLIRSIGITNQRETIIAWDKSTGQPFHNAIIWDDARTIEICEEFKHLESKVRSKTGLPISTYFSATKMVWLIRNIPSISEALKSQNCLFGTVESWVLWNLTETKVHVTDVSNASRTMLMNLNGEWDSELLEVFGIPLEALPKIVSNAEVYGKLNKGPLKGVPLAGAIGDQQSALLGHICLAPGSLKCTYGTGAFLLMNTGETPVQSTSGLLTTVYCQFGKGKKIQYALEGAVECAGSAVKWMMNNLQLFKSYSELENILNFVEKSDGVYCVPALNGIFAPYWNSGATGIFTGLTQHSTKGHLVRAVMEGIAFRTAEIIKSMKSDCQVEVSRLSVDGGMTENKFFMQEQADLAQVDLEISAEKDITALGAALCAGIGIGVYGNVKSLQKLQKKVEVSLRPRTSQVAERWVGWENAVKKCLYTKL